MKCNCFEWKLAGWWSSLFFFSAALAIAASEHATKWTEDFEHDFSDRKISSNWQDNSAWADLEVHYERETENPHSGRVAQKIICQRYNSGSVQIVRKAPVAIEKGKIYRVGVWARGTVTTGQISLDVREKDAPYTAYLTQTFQVSPEWQHYEILQESEGTDPACNVMVRFRGTGEVSLDDVEFEEVDPASFAGAGGSVDEKDINQLRNGTFEMAGEGWGCIIRGLDYFHGDDACMEGKYGFEPEAAHDGKLGLRIAVPKWGIGWLHSEPMMLAPKRTYTISCWARADTEDATLELGLAGGEGGQAKFATKYVKVGKKWERVQVQVEAPLVAGGLLSVRAGFCQEVQYDVDDFQVEEGATMRPFRPYGGADYGLLGMPEKGYVQQGTELAATVSRYTLKREDSADRRNVMVRVFDWTDKEVYKTNVVLDREAMDAKIKLPTQNSGVFRVEVFLDDKDRVAQCIYAVLPVKLAFLTQPPADQSFFGTHVTMMNDESLDFAWLTGSRWLRLHPPLATQWMVVENTKGEFVWHDELINKIRKKGFRILGTLNSTAVWASQHPELGFGWSGNKATSYPAKDIADWENYVREVVKHYAGKIDDWEVWNEPDINNFLRVDKEEDRGAEFVRLLSSAYKVVHEVNPKARVLAGGSSGIPTSKWCKTIAVNGGYSFLDILSFHYYSTPPNITESFFKDVATMRKLDDREGRTSLPLWNTESGILAPTTFYRRPDETKVANGLASQVSWVVLSYVGNKAADIERMFLYSSSASGLPTRSECATLREWNGAWRPTAVAAQVTALLLDGAKCIEAPSGKKAVQQAVFTKNGYQITCAWKNYDAPDKTAKFLVPARAFLVDVMGNVTQSNLESSVSIEGVPVWTIVKM